MKRPTDFKLKGRIRVAILQNGIEVQAFPWQRNLILNQGLDNLAEVFFADLFLYCAGGTGVLATQETPVAGNTYSQSATTVTRDAGGGTPRAFTSADVGRTIKFSGGQTCVITSFTDATHVEVNNSQTVATTTIVLYYTEQVGLSAEVKRTGTYSNNSGDNETTTNGSTPFERVLKRTFIFSAEVGTVNYEEIGFSNLSAAGNNLNIRVDLASTATVTAGQQLKVTYEFQITCAPLTSTAYNLATAAPGLSATNGHYGIEAWSSSVVDANGDTVATDTELEPAHGDSNSAVANLFTNSDAIATFADAAFGTRNRTSGAYSVELVADTYTPGDYSRTYTAVWDINQAPGAANLRGISIYNEDSGLSAFTFRSSAAFSKAADKTLTIKFQKTWDRDL